MKTFFALLLMTAAVFGQPRGNPSFQSFYTNQFTTNGMIIKLRLNPAQFDTNGTNISIVGGLNTNYWTIDGGNGTLRPSSLANGNDWPLNAKWYGAKGDGIADDTLNLQTALYSGAKEIYLPPGTYRVTSTLNITNGLRLRGYGATIKMIGNHTPVVQLISFNYGTIEGITFSTDQFGLATPMAAILGQSEAMNNVHIVGNTVNNMKTILRNTVTTSATCSNLWVTANTFNGDLTGVTGGDLGNVVDIRGFQGAHITGNNWYIKGADQALKFSNTSKECIIADNLFHSTSPAAHAPGGPMLDTFTACRKLIISHNHFISDDFGDVLEVKPSASGYFSEPCELEVNGNIFEYTNPISVGTPIAIYGSWGLTDQTLPFSQCTVIGNQVKVNAPIDTSGMIVVRGFTHANIQGNTITRSEHPDFGLSIDAANNKDTIIQGNLVEYGTVLIADHQSNPPGTVYTNGPQTVLFANNTIRNAQTFGCLWLTTLTNVRSVVVTGNILSTKTNTAPLIRFTDCSVTNLTITGNAGDSTYAYFQKVGSNTIANEMVQNNSWQAGGDPPVYIPQVGTNVVVDFKLAPYQICVTTNTIWISTINCVAGGEVELRLQAYDGPVNIAFDPTVIAVAGTAVTTIRQYSTTVVKFRSRAGGTCSAADVTAEIETSGDPRTIMSGGTDVGFLGNVFVGVDAHVASRIYQGASLILSASPSWTGTGSNFLSDDGTFKAAGGGGLTINPTFGSMPFKSGASSFADSPFRWLDATHTQYGNRATNGSVDFITVPTYGLVGAYGVGGGQSAYLQAGGFVDDTGLHISGASGGSVSLVPGYKTNYVNFSFYANSAQTNALMQVNRGAATNFLIAATSGYAGTGANFLSDDGTYKVPSGGGGGGTTINPTDGFMPYRLNGTTFSNAPVHIVSLTNTVLDGPLIFGPGVTNGIYRNGNDLITMAGGLINGRINGASGYTGAGTKVLYDDGTYKTAPAGGGSGAAGTNMFTFRKFDGGLIDYTLTNAFSPVVFDAGFTDIPMETPTLDSGTYLITVASQFHQYRLTGQQAHIILYNTEDLGSFVSESERWVGPELLPDPGFYGDWPIFFQSQVTINTSGKIQVWAHNDVSGDTTSVLRSTNSTISWVKQSAGLTGTSPVSVDEIDAGSLVVTNAVTAGGLVTGSIGVASTATDAAVNTAATGWTNSFGKNAVVYLDGTSMTYVVYNNALTPVYTNAAATTHATIPLQKSGKVIVTAGTGVTGRAVPW